MHLYLLRHAKSSWDDPTLVDHDRPLAPRGRRATETIAGHLRAQRIAPDLILCSSAARTQETLARISGAFGGPDNVAIETEGELYGASGEQLLARLREVPVGVNSVMLIGHNPGIQDLAIELADGEQAAGRLNEKFPTAALATYAVTGRWVELTSRSARLVDFRTPRELERSIRQRPEKGS